MHGVPWRDHSQGLRGQAGVKHVRDLSLRSGGAAQSRSIYAGQDVRELSSGAHLRGAQEAGPGRQVITISGSGILGPLAGFPEIDARFRGFGNGEISGETSDDSGRDSFPDAGRFSEEVPQESPGSPKARDRGHPQGGFWGVETEATRRTNRMCRSDSSV